MPGISGRYRHAELAERVVGANELATQREKVSVKLAVKPRRTTAKRYVSETRWTVRLAGWVSPGDNTLCQDVIHVIGEEF